MDFKKLGQPELKELAEFFVVDVVAADEEKPTKKELLAALTTGDDALTEEDYETFKAAKAAGQDKAPEGEEIEKQVADAKESAAETEPVDTSNYVLIKFEGKNPTLEIVGYTFQRKHPYRSVPPEIAEYLVRKQTGFRLAMPSELTDYYN